MCVCVLYDYVFSKCIGSLERKASTLNFDFFLHIHHMCSREETATASCCCQQQEGGMLQQNIILSLSLSLSLSFVVNCEIKFRNSFFVLLSLLKTAERGIRTTCVRAQQCCHSYSVTVSPLCGRTRRHEETQKNK